MGVPTKLLATAIDFGTLSGHSGTPLVAYVEFWSAATGGSFCFAGPIGGTSPFTVPVPSGTPLLIPANSISWRLKGYNNSEIWNTNALAILDNMLGYPGFGPATYYPRLFLVKDDGAGTGGTEFPTTGNYVAAVTAAAITNNTTNFPAATLV